MNKEKFYLEYGKQYPIDNEVIKGFVMNSFIANEFNSSCMVLHTNRCRYILPIGLVVKLMDFDIIGKILTWIYAHNDTIELITTEGSYYVETSNE